MRRPDPMNFVRAAKLPGFYTDERNAYGIVLGTPRGPVYICCAVDREGLYDVSANYIGDKGVFSRVLEQYADPKPFNAIEKLRYLTKKYGQM